MRRKPVSDKKLRLQKETVRKLTLRQLARVAGGTGGTGVFSAQTSCCPDDPTFGVTYTRLC